MSDAGISGASSGRWLGGRFLVERVGAELARYRTQSIPDLGKSQIIRGHEPHA